MYVPGYDSNNVIRFDPRTGATSVAIASRQGGISRPRGLLLSKDREFFFLVAEQSGQVMKWKIADGTLTELARGFPVASMAAYAPDGNLLIATSNSIAKIDPSTGARLGTLVTAGSGGLSGSTFIAVVPTSLPAVDRSQIGTQYWVIGDAPVNGRVLDLPNVYTGTGTSFGDGLKFSELSIKRWGSVRIEWLSCTRARFSWRSTGTNTANFGDGEYEITRFFANENDSRCAAANLDAPDKSWIAGSWWGGDSRSGEGLFLDRRQDGFERRAGRITRTGVLESATQTSDAILSEGAARINRSVDGTRRRIRLESGVNRLGRKALGAVPIGRAALLTHRCRA